MTQATVAAPFEGQAPALPPQGPGHEPARSSTDVTLWLFGLTAMLLAFVSLQSLGLVVRSAPTDAWEGIIVGLPTVAAAGVALVALAYVYVVSRRYGVLASADDQARERGSNVADGLVVSPTVPPRMAMPYRTANLQPRRSRSRQVRAIADVTRVRPQAARKPWQGPPVLPRTGLPPTSPRMDAIALQLQVAGLRAAPAGPWAPPAYSRPRLANGMGSLISPTKAP